jgi:hypothetical protein
MPSKRTLTTAVARSAVGWPFPSRGMPKYSLRLLTEYKAAEVTSTASASIFIRDFLGLLVEELADR